MEARKPSGAVLALAGRFALRSSSRAAGPGPPLGNRIVPQPLAEFAARLAAAALTAFGNAQALGTQLQFNGFEVVVVDACDGVLPTFIYLAAIPAFNRPLGAAPGAAWPRTARLR